MPSIQMVDLVEQHQSIYEELNNAIDNVVNSAKFINGPDVGTFEKNLAHYLDVAHVIACGNGTDALQIALMALDLPENSEVISPDFTFVASAEAIIAAGHQPVLVDCDPDTYNMDPDSLENAISPHTKAIIPVHLFGQCANMDAIKTIADKNKLYIIEDTAQALGAKYHPTDGTGQHAGTIGDIGCTSFFPSKNLGCLGDGGALFTNDDELAQKIKEIKNHGMSQQYSYNRIGMNSRLDTVQAAILNVKLKYLDQYNHKRQKAAEQYDELLKAVPNVQVPVRSNNSTHIFHQYTLKISGDRRDQLSQHLNDQGIPNKVYYPTPLHVHAVYQNYQSQSGNEVTKALTHQVLSLPMHPALKEDQINYIAHTIKQFFA